MPTACYRPSMSTQGNIVVAFKSLSSPNFSIREPPFQEALRPDFPDVNWKRDDTGFFWNKIVLRGMARQRKQIWHIFQMVSWACMIDLSLVINPLSPMAMSSHWTKTWLMTFMLKDMVGSWNVLWRDQICSEQTKLTVAWAVWVPDLQTQKDGRADRPARPTCTWVLSPPCIWMGVFHHVLTISEPPRKWHFRCPSIKQ